MTERSLRTRLGQHRRLWSRPAVAVLAAWVVALSSPAAQACQACFGAEEAPLVDGARSGAWFLLAVTMTMQGAFATFFICLWRRSRRMARQVQSRWSESEQTAR